MTQWAAPIPKVTALITRPGRSGPELLVFDHGLAGVQIPAGTVEEGEAFAAGARREGWEETGALGLELVGELAVLRRDFVGRSGALVHDVSADGRIYPRGNHVKVLRVAGEVAEAELWDGTPVGVASSLIARSEERHVFHLRATVAMPDDWIVVSPDGAGVAWTCFWAPVDEVHELLHENQRDWLDASRPALERSAAGDPEPLARAQLPAGFDDDDEVFERFVAPPLAGRRYAIAMTDACEPETCRRAHGLCVTAGGEVVLIRDENGFWDLPGGGKEAGETTAENFAREVWEEASARVVDSRFLTALRIVELDERGGPVGAVELHARMWARVELEPWEPQFETTARTAMSPGDAAELSLIPTPHAALLDRAAGIDPRLDWKPGAE